MIKLSSLALFIGLTANSAFAEEDFDASDLTRASTTALLSASNQGELKFTGSLSYKLSNGQEAMTSLEATMDKDGDYSNSRAQYFHVFSFDNPVTPRVAVSLDVIDNKSFTTAALGGISIFRTSYEPLTFFGRAAVLAGQYDEDFARSLGETNTDIVGGMAAAYAVLKTGNDGSFLALYPEYTYLDGDITMNTVKTTFMAATPMSADAKRWGQIKIENTVGDIKTNSLSINRSLDSETKVWFNYKIYM